MTKLTAPKDNRAIKSLSALLYRKEAWIVALQCVDGDRCWVIETSAGTYAVPVRYDVVEACYQCLHYGDELGGDPGSACDRCRGYSNFM